MGLLLWIHIAGGAVGLLMGFAALGAGKGTPLHRRAGRLFVYAMLAMGVSGALIAAFTGVETSVIMGSLVAYLVFTGLTTVAPLHRRGREVSFAGATLALALSLALFELAIRGLMSPSGAVEGLPAPMAFLFGAVAFHAGLSDIRLARVGGELRGGKRLARHLWRMCLALFIASASFFLGQMQVLPAQLRAPWFVVPPVIAPIVAMGYWIWKTRTRRVARQNLSPSADPAGRSSPTLVTGLAPEARTAEQYGRSGPQFVTRCGSPGSPQGSGVPADPPVHGTSGT